MATTVTPTGAQLQDCFSDLGEDGQPILNTSARTQVFRMRYRNLKFVFQAKVSQVVAQKRDNTLELIQVWLGTLKITKKRYTRSNEGEEEEEEEEEEEDQDDSDHTEENEGTENAVHDVYILYAHGINDKSIISSYICREPDLRGAVRPKMKLHLTETFQGAWIEHATELLVESSPGDQTYDFFCILERPKSHVILTPYHLANTPHDALQTIAKETKVAKRSGRLPAGDTPATGPIISCEGRWYVPERCDEEFQDHCCACKLYLLLSLPQHAVRWPESRDPSAHFASSQYQDLKALNRACTYPFGVVDLRDAFRDKDVSAAKVAAVINFGIGDVDQEDKDERQEISASLADLEKRGRLRLGAAQEIMW
ncbi:hypothetical protein LTS02_005845 [Friedmanniomyces endolithicus]|nr:hypothetical protein LTS02_005845 [Friedmanniomyces endolithicus]